MASVNEIQKLRKEAARKKRRLIHHSDGKAMRKELMYLESEECVFPYIEGVETGVRLRLDSGEEVTIPRSEIRKAHLVFSWK